jgi:hypothetical protein
MLIFFPSLVTAGRPPMAGGKKKEKISFFFFANRKELD